MTYLLYLGVGGVVGFFSGLLGLAGGVFIVPALLFIFSIQGIPPGIAMQLAVATSLACVLVTSPASIYTHHQKNTIRWDLLRKLLPSVVLGALLGGALAIVTDGNLLQLLFGIFQLCIGAQLLVGRFSVERSSQPSTGILRLAGRILGILSALLGIASSLTTSFLVFSGVPMRNAIATATAVGFLIALFSTMVYATVNRAADFTVANTLGYIYLPALLGIALSSIPAARFGSLLSQQVSHQVLRKAFGFILLVLGCRFVWLHMTQYLSFIGY